MKSFKRAFAIFASTLLGLTSCRVEYGCPSADYTIKGKVTDPEENPIPNILVTFQRGEHLQDGSVRTDVNGDYCIRHRGVDIPPDAIVFEDIDGPANGGQFRSKTVSGVEYVQQESGDGHWYQGSFIAPNVNVTLLPENQQ